jgi:hypothetical protein
MYSVPSTVGLHLNSNTDPSRLFDQGKRGSWYEPSEFSTMFQDYQGRVPVTAVGQPVSLILDKAENIVLGPELTTVPNMGATADWTNVSGITNISVANSVLSFEQSVTLNNRLLRSSFSTNVMNISAYSQNQWYKVSLEVRQTGGTTGKNMYSDIYSNIITYLGSTNVVSSTNDWQEISCIVNSNRTMYLLIYIGVSGVAGDIFEARNLSVKHLSGNHCQQFTPTKAPLLQQDANSKYYLDFDGSDDFLQCPYSTIGAGDGKGAYVCAGVTKDSDVSRGMIFGYNTTDDTTSNAFSLYAPSADGNADYGFQAKGSTSTIAVTAAATAPSTNVLTGLMSEPGSYTKLRVNGVEQATDATSLGATALNSFRNFYIGGRQGTSLFFNGGLYSLIFVSSPPNFEKVTTAERYVNDKTQAY